MFDILFPFFVGIYCGMQLQKLDLMVWRPSTPTPPATPPPSYTHDDDPDPGDVNTPPR